MTQRTAVSFLFYFPDKLNRGTYQIPDRYFSLKGGMVMVLGIPDFWIWSAYLLCIISTLIGVVYGIANWNKGGNDESKQIIEEKKWDEKEQSIEETL
jgi:hypothetical protein